MPPRVRNTAYIHGIISADVREKHESELFHGVIKQETEYTYMYIVCYIECYLVVWFRTVEINNTDAEGRLVLGKFTI